MNKLHGELVASAHEVPKSIKEIINKLPGAIDNERELNNAEMQELKEQLAAANAKLAESEQAKSAHIGGGKSNGVLEAENAVLRGEVQRLR